MPTLYGLIGYPLEHSFSPAYFKKKFADLDIDAVYKAFPIERIGELTELLRSNTNLAGLNVTIPYKQAVMRYTDEVDVIAKETGAVNCIALKEGKIMGYNTDVTGFEQSLIPLLQPQHSRALILGTGGSARAVAYALEKLGLPFQRVSRYLAAGDLTYEELTPEIISTHKLIINTTPLGQYPKLDAAPNIPYDAIGKHHLLFDLIYNPEETRFLALGKERGAIIKNGFEMLKLQADASWHIWQSHAAASDKNA